MNTTLTTVLYTSKTLSDGTHPLMLRLTKNRRIKYISLHISLDAKFWDFDKSRPKRNCPDKERINTLIEYKSTFLGIPVTRSLTLRGSPHSFEPARLMASRIISWVVFRVVSWVVSVSAIIPKINSTKSVQPNS